MVNADSGSEACSPYSGGAASPYSDSSAGLPSPPTVVVDYNRPFDAVGSDEPHLVIVEQPQTKFRYRYKSEMVGTHGQLKGESSHKNKAIFPTVQLMNWSDGAPALIRLALYTGEDNLNLRRRHVHELSGKNCDNGVCEVVVDQTTDYTASFQSLGIIHIAKRDVKEIVKQRKKAELIELARLRRPHWTVEDARQSIIPTDLKKLEEEASEVARNMDLNKVVMRFQAFHYDTSVDGYRPITRPVDSDLVFNLKNASTGELKIVRMSECSAPCTGGTPVWMLVEKVKKNNIKIKFFEVDADDNEVWSAYAEFSEGDVHHQYAIIFRTPPYRSTTLRSSVNVKVQLERPNDRDCSEPKDFTYCPENRKRQSPFMQTGELEEDEEYHHGSGAYKRQCCPPGKSEPLDLTYMQGGGGGGGGCQTGDIIEMLGQVSDTNQFFKGFSGSCQQESSNNLLSAELSPQYTMLSPPHHQHRDASPNSNSNSSTSFYSGVSEAALATSAGAAAQPFFMQEPTGGASPVQVVVNSEATSLQFVVQAGGCGAAVIVTGCGGGGAVIGSEGGGGRGGLTHQYQQAASPLYQQVPSPQQISSPPYQVPSPQQSIPSPQQTAYLQTPSPVAYQQSTSPVAYQQSTSPLHLLSTNSSQYTLNVGVVADQLVPNSPNNQLSRSPTNLSTQMQGQTQQQSLQQRQQHLQQPQAQAQQQMVQQQLPTQHRQQQMPQQGMSPTMQTSFVAPQDTVEPALAGGDMDFSNLLQVDPSGLCDLSVFDNISLDTINTDFFSDTDTRIDGAAKKDLRTDCGGGKATGNKSSSRTSTIALADNMKNTNSNIETKLNKPTNSGNNKNSSNNISNIISNNTKTVGIKNSRKISVDDITASLGAVKLNNDTQKSQEMPLSPNSVDVAFRVAVSAAESLQAYATTGDLARLLATHRYLLAVQTRHGDNALHSAVSNKKREAFHKILNAAGSLRPQDLLNAQNLAGQTALHLAVEGGEVAMTARLISAVGSDVSLPDRGGNTPLHLAAALPRCRHAATDIAVTGATAAAAAADIMTLLLTKPVNGTRSSLMKSMQAYNYHGETALHIAVRHGNVVAVRQLVAAGADVHQCERRRGANCLHFAAQHHHHDIAAFLISQTSMTVNARMFDGNTALHVAAQERDATMCALLLSAGADPTAKNSLKLRRKARKAVNDKSGSGTQADDAIGSEYDEEEDDEDEDEDEDEDDEEGDESDEPSCYTPLDYAGGNLEVIRVLRGIASSQQAESITTCDATTAASKPTSDCGGSSSGGSSSGGGGGMDSGIDISVTDLSCTASTLDAQYC